MTRFEGPDEISNFLGERGYREFAQMLAQTECHICKRLYGEHSPEEFKTHSLSDATIDMELAPVTPHCLLHFRGHKCTECAKCEECSKLLEEERAQA